MKKNPTSKYAYLFISFLLIPLFAFTSSPFEITIDIAPNVLNLSNNGTVVTVHTNLPYSSVQGSTSSLDGVVIQSWKADNRGLFVAKFSMNAIKSLNLTVNEYHTFRLQGNTVNGEEFFGTQDILIINRSGN